jgi:mannosyltransferase
MNPDNSNMSSRGASLANQLAGLSWKLFHFVRSHAFIILFILFLAFALRMYHASTTLMWGDEGFSVYSASRDLYAITFEGKDVDPHPPLYYYLFHFWLPLAGASKLAIRFFSIFFGTATVAMVYTLGRKFFTRRVGSAAAALFAIAPFAVEYSQEVRMYALVMFLGAVTTYIFVKWFDSTNPPRKGNKALGLAFFFAMFLTQYSLYQSAFLFVAQGIFLLPFLKTRFRFFLQWLAASVLIVLLFIPWLTLHSSSAFVDIKDVAGNSKPMSLLEFLSRGFAGIAVGLRVPLNLAFTLSEIVLVILIAGIALALITRKATQNDWLLAVHIAIPMLMYYPIYYLAPLYRGRLFALALVPLVILLVRSMGPIRARVKWAAVPLAIFLLGSYLFSLGYYFYNYSRYNASVDDYIPAIRAIEQRAETGDVILFHAYWQIGYFITEYHGAPVEYRLLDNAQDVSAAAEKSHNVWAIVQGLPIHGGEVTLDRTAYPYDETDYGQMRVLSYRAGNPGRAQSFSPPIQFENGMTLLGYRVDDTPVESGHGAVTLELQWQAARKIGDDFTVSVRLINAQEQVISQIDSPPVAGLSPTSNWNPGEKVIDRRGLPIPANAPAGDYAVQMLVYQYVDNRVIGITAPENYQGTILSLGTIPVVPQSK